MFMSIVGKAIMAILTLKSTMATLAPILNDPDEPINKETLVGNLLLL